MAYDIYISVRKIQEKTNILTGTDDDGNPIKYEDLSEEEQKALGEFYDSFDVQNDEKMMLMARESSVQLTYQNALLLYQFTNRPILELSFTGNIIKPGSVVWILGLAFQIFSIGLSANSTFGPIIQNIYFKSLKRQKPIGFLNYAIQIFQVLIHLIFASGMVYLLKVKNIEFF